MSGSSIGTIAGGLIGGLLGFFVPVVGAAIGFSLGVTLGGAIGGFIDTPKRPEVIGPRLTDLSIQTSTYGAFIPRVYGKIAVLGNIFWLENNQITEVAKKVSQGGKVISGGGATTKTYSYYGTFALGLCEGPIAGILRIWIGSQLFYDITSNIPEVIQQSSINSRYFKLYLGTDDQLADPRIQASLGAANVPGYRGLAYIVFYDLPLKDYGNSIQSSQIKVEIVKKSTQALELIYVETIPIHPEWHTTQANSGNCFDDDGNTNYVVSILATEAPGPFSPHLIKTVNSNFISQTAIPLNGQPSAPVVTSFNQLIYAYLITYLGLPSICYGNSAGQNVFSISSGQIIRQIAEGSGNVFVLKTNSSLVYFLHSIPFSDPENVVVTEYANLSMPHLSTPFMAVWNGQAVTFNVEVNVLYIYIYAAETLSLVDSYTINIPNPIINRLFPGESCGAVDVKYDILYIMATIDVTSARIFIVDLINKTLIYNQPVNADVVDITSSRFANMRVIDGYIKWAQRKTVTADNELFVANAWYHNKLANSSTFLNEIVEAECIQSKFLSASDVDVTELTDIVRGYRVSELAAIRGGIDPLRTAWPFDAIQSGYKIKFKRRGSSSVDTIDSEFLDARSSGTEEGVVISQSREMDAALPRKVVIKYFDAVREYDVSEQYNERINTDAVNELVIDLPIVFNADEAAQKAETLLYLYWLERNDLLFKLPPIYSNLEPGDVITITGDNATYEARLTAIDYTSDGRLECKAKYNKSVIYTTYSEGEEGQSTGVELVLTGPSNYELLDIPLLQSVYDEPGFTIAMSGYLSGWPGGVIYQSKDNGQSWLDVQGFDSQGSTIGYALSTMAVHGGTVLDKTNRLTIRLSSGTLSSVTEQQMFSGQNWFAYGLDGRWEIIAAQNCILQGDGSYILSDFLRGQMGSEWATGLHALNDKIIYLSSDELNFITVDSLDIGISYLYRGITLEKDIDSDFDRSFSYDAVNLECLSPVHLSGNRHPTTNNWTITWIRRTRFAGWRDYIDAELGEDTESYTIEIYSSSAFTTLKRTLSSTTQSVAYTSAQQVTDFGSVQSTLHLKIYQNSAIVGKGYALQQLITRP